MQRYTPNQINSLNSNEIFVFGSNERARHGAGAALHAVKKFGARDGVHGLVGCSYGIPTKDKYIQTLPLTAIAKHIEEFHRFVASRPDLTFYVTEVGCGLAGYRPSDIAPLFKTHKWGDNVVFPERFHV